VNALKLAILALIVLILAQLNQWSVLDNVFFTIIGLLVIAWTWSWVSLRGVEIERQTPGDRSQVGQPFSERLRLRNQSRLQKLWVEVLDQSTFPGHHVSKVVHLGPHDSTRWRVETICARRGRFRIGPVQLRSGDPFGLFPSTRLIPDSAELVVYPATVELSSFTLPVGELPGGSAIQRRTPFVTPNAAGVRDYFSGDAFNRIAWRATARTGKLMVKEFELDPTADLWIALDLDGSVQAGATGASVSLPGLQHGETPLTYWLDSTEEYGVTIAASLARHFLNQNRNVGLLVNTDQHVVIPADRGARQMLKVLEQLAVVSADGSMPLAELLVSEGGLFTRNSTLVVVTPSTSESWVQAVVGVASRHVQTVAILIEPSTFGGGESSLMVVSDLAAVNIPTYLVKHGDDISRALSSYAVSSSGPVRR
jgi:uncharacterized protein (DUF58 family)